MLAAAVALTGALTAGFASNGTPTAEDTTGVLAPLPVHEETVEAILDRLDNHYVNIRLDDQLSSSLLDQYLKDLDGNRLYFLASDIASFEAWRKQLDNQLADNDLGAGYAIFNLYQQRARERVDYVLGLLDDGIDELDLEDNESILVDRSKADWAASEEESNALWRKRLEDAVIAMRLDGTDDETIVERLQQRYNSQRKRLDQSTSEDVFQLYVN